MLHTSRLRTMISKLEQVLQHNHAAVCVACLVEATQQQPQGLPCCVHCTTLQRLVAADLDGSVEIICVGNVHAP